MSGERNSKRNDEMTSNTRVTFVKPDGSRKVNNRAILREHRLELWVNERLFGRLVCTPNHLEDLVVGRLISEQIITRADEIEELYICDSGNRARVFLKKEISFQHEVMEEPTCCADNKIYLQEADPEASNRIASNLQPSNPTAADSAPRQKPVWEDSWVFAMADAFLGDSALHRSTGGTHSCVLANEGKIIHVTEDIGRHNALDKIIGYVARQGLDREKCMVFTTGRVPVDMVRKMLAARLPILISKSVPTMDAVELASQNGLTLICRAWPDSFEVFC